MKSVTSALATHLNTKKEFTSCDLVELVLANGNTYRYTNADVDIVWDNKTYRHDALIIRRQQINIKSQVTVDTLDVTVYTDPEHTADMIESLPIQKVAHAGVLDGAKIYLRRAFFISDGGELPGATVVGVIGLFGGDVEIKKSSGIKLELTVKSKTQGLNMEFPIRKYYPQGAYTTSNGTVVSTGTTNDTCLIAPFVPRREVLLW